jgi:hypothetical protein
VPLIAEQLEAGYQMLTPGKAPYWDRVRVLPLMAEDLRGGYQMVSQMRYRKWDRDELESPAIPPSAFPTLGRFYRTTHSPLIGPRCPLRSRFADLERRFAPLSCGSQKAKHNAMLRVCRA